MFFEFLDYQEHTKYNQYLIKINLGPVQGLLLGPLSFYNHVNDVADKTLPSVNSLQNVHTNVSCIENNSKSLRWWHQGQLFYF